MIPPLYASGAQTHWWISPWFNNKISIYMVKETLSLTVIDMVYSNRCLPIKWLSLEEGEEEEEEQKAYESFEFKMCKTWPQ